MKKKRDKAKFKIQLKRTSRSRGNQFKKEAEEDGMEDDQSDDDSSDDE